MYNCFQNMTDTIIKNSTTESFKLKLLSFVTCVNQERENFAIRKQILYCTQVITV